MHTVQYIKMNVISFHSCSSEEMEQNRKLRITLKMAVILDLQCNLSSLFNALPNAAEIFRQRDLLKLKTKIVERKTSSHIHILGRV